LLVQVGPTEREEIIEKLKTIEAKLQNEIASIQRDPEAKDTLSNLLNYIKSGYSNFLSSTNSPSKIQKLEADLFMLLEKINKLTLDSTQEEYSLMKQSIADLTKEISGFRIFLEKEIKEGQNVVENKSYVDHLEDLQENLADLVYSFSGKFDEFSKSLVGDAVVQKQVSLAQNKHKMGNFYEL